LPINKVDRFAAVFLSAGKANVKFICWRFLKYRKREEFLMPKDFAVTVLLDVYGMMLTDRQRETMELYYEEDLSLGEIAEITSITRQGVMNCLKKSEAHLKSLETKLGLVRKLREFEEDIAELEKLLMSSEMTNEKVMADIDDLLVAIKKKL